MVRFWIISGPAYASGDYAPGQVITVGFELIPQVKVAKIPVIRASVRDVTNGVDGEVGVFENLKGELDVTLSPTAANGQTTLRLTVNDLHFVGDVHTYDQRLNVNANMGAFAGNIAGMSVADLVLMMLVIVILIILVFMLMKGMGGGAAAASMAAAPAAAPAPKPAETYAPKAAVKCPACSTMVDVATSKRPIEVMCPKCGTSQVVS